jgi:hypothetical protein
MTSIATVLGLIPMAIGLGGESTQAPLATAVIGGLVFSTVLTLFFVPLLYVTFEERFKREIHEDDEIQTAETQGSTALIQPESDIPSDDSLSGAKQKPKRGKPRKTPT